MTDECDAFADPAAAATVPEPDRVTTGGEPVHAVGIGPGNRAYLTRRAEHLLREADVVVGFETVVEYVGGLTDADLLGCGYDDEAEALAAFVFERLTHDDEETTRTTLDALAERAGGTGPDDAPFDDLSVLCVRAGESGGVYR